jgi:hypothetical protein
MLGGARSVTVSRYARRLRVPLSGKKDSVLRDWMWDKLGDLALGASVADDQRLPDLARTVKTRRDFIEGSFLVNAAVKSINQRRRSDSKGLRNSQKCPYGDRPTRLNLLPMAGRETKTDHVLLCVTMLLTKFLNSNPQRTKELSLIYHPLYLGA